MKKILLLLILFPALFFSQSSAKYPTLLWEIKGNGLKKSSYLYGTMHVSNRVAYYLSEQFFDALKSVEVVGLETNPGEWLENMEKTGELSELSQIKSNNFTSDFYRSAFAVSFPEKRIMQGILSYDPDIINGLLYRQNKMRENFEESTYIDLFIFQSASKLNKKLISLENFAQSEIMARLSALPDEEGGNNANANMYTNAQKIEDAYRDGNLDVIDSLSKISSSNNTQKYLIVERNFIFANTIDSVLKKNSLFSGVGAAHLPGQQGVIELLRKKGYSVEPVFPKVSKKSNAQRDKLDEKVKSVAFSKQFAEDSLFSVNVPGRLYPIVDIPGLNYFIHADMVNGSFYTVVRLKHMAPLFNLNKEQIQARIDSLLFEHIPGKILEKKELATANGIKGIEIINRMRRGDEQHYHIYFTDLEMIMFKLGGKRDYASSKESKQFFNSIQFRNKSDNNISYAPPAHGFSVSIPANYSYSRQEGSGVSGLVEDLYAYNSGTKQSFGVRRAVFNDFNYLEEDTFELNQLAKNTLHNYNFKSAASYSLSFEMGLPAISFTAANAAGAGFYGKITIKGVHYYLAFMVGSDANSFNSQFFKSFAITDFKHLHPIKEITDHEFYFKTKDEVTDNALSRFNEAYIKAYESTSKIKRDTLKTDYDFRSGSKFYYSPSTNEYVSISFEKYNDYDYRNPAEIRSKIEKSFKMHTTAVVEKRMDETQNGLRQLRYLLKDTASARAIDVRVFFKGGIMHEITAAFDTTIGMKGWIKSFMDAFTPFDSVIGKDIFQNKFNVLLNDLVSADTVARRAAEKSLQNSITLQKEYAGSFLNFISGKQIHQVSEDSRAQLFVNGGTLETEKILPVYRQLYKQYTDSFYLQLCLLKGLAYLKTPASYSTFVDLISTEAPLVGDENAVSDVFAVLHDSLELCSNMFPAMLSLVKYDEYRDPVYTLLASLVNNKLIAPSKYAGKKNAILADAHLALKRYNPTNKTPGENSSDDLAHLEKSAKELAESILGNLEGLTKNNMYKNSDVLKSMDTYNRLPLVNYAFVLAPFYTSDAEVKDFINKLARVKNQKILMPLAVNLLKYNVQLNDTIAEHYASNRFTRAYFYSELEKESLQEKFSKDYLTQQSLIESVLSSQKQLTNLYTTGKEKVGKDSTVLIRVLPAANKYQKGKLYIYRNAKVRNEDEQWSVVFVADGSGAVSSKIDVIASHFQINPMITEQENINELLEHFTLAYRKRAVMNNAANE